MCETDLDKWTPVVEASTIFIREAWRGSDPSPFKRATGGAMGIVACGPIDEHIPESTKKRLNLDKCSFAGHPSLLKAIIADSFARYVLVGAEVGKGPSLKKLVNPIRTSSHFRTDVLWLLTQVKFTDGKLFNPLSLIYEACAYQENPDAQDDF